MIAPTTPWCDDLSGSKRMRGAEHPHTLEAAGNLAECNGHDFGKETRPRGEPEDWKRRDIFQEWIEPLNNEFASAQDLLDAFSTTPPSISRAASPEPDHPKQQNACSRSQADAVRNAPSLIGDHGGTVLKFEPVSPFTCTEIFETPAALWRDVSRVTNDVRSNRSASFWGSSFGGVRSVTDDASSKLAHDLASKLAQRRAWESSGSERRSQHSHTRCVCRLMLCRPQIKECRRGSCWWIVGPPGTYGRADTIKGMHWEVLFTSLPRHVVATWRYRFI